MEDQKAPDTGEKKINGGLKFALEMGPLLLFFLANSKYGLIVATSTLVVTTAISMAILWVLVRKIPKVLFIGALFVGFFGGLTIFFEDETFIKIKPTVINALFGVILLGGLSMGKIWLKSLFEAAFQVDDEGWRKLTLRWGLFFLAMAVLNEAVWRSVDTDTWVTFKAFGLIPLSIIFAIAQTPVIMKHSLNDKEEDPADPS